MLNITNNYGKFAMKFYEEESKEIRELYGCTNRHCSTMGDKKLFDENGQCPFCRVSLLPFGYQTPRPHYVETFRDIINSNHETTKQILEIAKEYSEKIASLEQELKNYKNRRFKKLVKKFNKKL